MKITKVSQKGIDLIKSFEGFSAKPYKCPADVWTIGYGTTIYPNGERVKITDKNITKEEGEGLLKHDLSVFEKQVDAITRDDINQSQFDALVSFAYNLGSTNLRKSTLLKYVNLNPNDKRIAKEFSKWVYAGGKKLNGLIRRRNAESELYFNTL